MYLFVRKSQGQSYDMGRRSLSPLAGENQSIWMHMSYKYYLASQWKSIHRILSEMKGGGILPFMDPDVYGRSLMECSSFIACSLPLS
jgi:hypothetical protein